VPVLSRRPSPAGWIVLALGASAACAGQSAPPPTTSPPPAAAAEAPPAILAELPSRSPQALAAALARPEPERPLVLDVRRDDEFAQGHIPGAVHIPHDRLAARLAELAGAQDREVVVYCRSGRRAALALETLKNAGFRRLAHLRGDYPGWVEAQAAEPVSAEPGSTGVAPPEVPE
jgi:rhodanese-related sulfurtransferase